VISWESVLPPNYRRWTWSTLIGSCVQAIVAGGRSAVRFIVTGRRAAVHRSDCHRASVGGAQPEVGRRCASLGWASASPPRAGARLTGSGMVGPRRDKRRVGLLGCSEPQCVCGVCVGGGGGYSPDICSSVTTTFRTLSPPPPPPWKPSDNLNAS
jgi:hypothetical protein